MNLTLESEYNRYFVKFCQLDCHRLMACLQLRQDVFMIEQNSLYRDLDGLDLLAWHYLLEQDKQVFAYARIIPPHSPDDDVHIGRLVIAPEFRAKGLGRKMMLDLIAESHQLFPSRRIAISAQAHLTGFYQSLGFECVGDIYDDGGVGHIDMINAGGFKP